MKSLILHRKRLKAESFNDEELPYEVLEDITVMLDIAYQLNLPLAQERANHQQIFLESAIN